MFCKSYHGLTIMSKNEIIIYQAENQSTHLEVRLDDETVWLNRIQISILFDRDVKTIGKHINNVFSDGELQKDSTVAKFATVQYEGDRQVERLIEYYNLDVIISVGYRVKSPRGTQFRIWANKILKEYLLKGYVVNQRIERVENEVIELRQKVNEFDLQLKTSLPPKEGIFFEGQVFDAYTFVSELIKSAKNSLILIDNYVDESVLMMFSKRNSGVSAKIYTLKSSQQLQLDLQKHNSQYPAIEIVPFSKSHDRFLIIDHTSIYHIGASLKDLGKRWFAFSKINLEANLIIQNLTS